MQLTCLRCKFPILETFYFCPNCGKKFKNPPVSTSILSQIKIYLVCILFPPFGLIPAIKYLLDKNKKAKIIGFVALLITVIATAIVISVTKDLFNQLTSLLNGQYNQINTPFNIPIDINNIQNTQNQRVQDFNF